MASVFRTNMIDMLTPDEAEQQAIVISTETTEALHSKKPITLLFDYDDTLPSGVVLPLKLSVMPVSEGAAGAFRKTFRRSIPSRYTFLVYHGGQYLVLLKEMFHNRWFGTLMLEVEGDRLESVPLTRRV